MLKKFILIILVAFSVNIALAAENETGKINLALAFSLHPRMSLFDFDRMGFFKVKPGLTEADFSKEIEKLRKSPAVNDARKRKLEIEEQIRALDKQRAEISARMMDLVDQKTGQNFLEQIKQLAESQEILQNKLYDIKFEIECPDLTRPEETRKILNEIEAEVFSAIDKVASDLKLQVVLNSSLPYSLNYPQRYQSGPMFGQGIPGISFNIFYAFLTKQKNEVLPGHQPPSSRNLINWLELTSFPEAVNLLPIKPWPIVLKGGRNIISDVLKIVYEKHGIDKEIFATVDSVLHKIETDSLPQN